MSVVDLQSHKETSMAELAEHFAMIQPETAHYFSDGLYGRLMTCEEGQIVIGKTHKQAHFAILLEGVIQVKSKHGNAQFKAPYIMESKVGDKRGFYSLTKTRWLTVHATDETDIEILENTLVDKI